LRRAELLLFLLAVSLCGCSRWGSMDHPIYHKPQSFSFEPPSGSVPVQGIEAPMTRDEADQKLKNPVPFDQASLEEGRKRFEIDCALCHGPDARGHGPISTKFIPPPDLTQDLFKGRSDGYLYATIRNGGAVMPAYGERLTPKERWDVVNYLRKLQGK
jgi:mono/diheme cytochrome c family protein